jgi:undecaprenyl-diphosphatase
MLGAIWVAALMLHAGPGDQLIYQWLYTGGEPSGTHAALGLSYLGSSQPLLSLVMGAALLLTFRLRPFSALSLLLLSQAGHSLINLQKAWIGQARPNPDLWLTQVHSMGFPSGHAAQSMFVLLALSLLLTRMERRWRSITAAAVLLSVAIGVSRVMLGVHWPTQVIAGWAFGAAWAVIWSTSALALEDRFSSVALDSRL